MKWDAELEQPLAIARDIKKLYELLSLLKIAGLLLNFYQLIMI